MNLVLIGVNHRTAPVEVRERFAIPEARLPEAIAVLLKGNREALRGFSDKEIGMLITLLTRLIANLDRIAGVEASPGAAISEKGD